MKNVEARINHLNELLREGRAMEAFETYYHDDVVMQENENAPTVGKAANREREEEFFRSVTEFRSATPLHTMIDEDKSLVVWHFDYTHKDWGVRNYTQASVQTWKEGKIIKEQFIYGN